MIYQAYMKGKLGLFPVMEYKLQLEPSPTEADFLQKLFTYKLYIHHEVTS